MTEMDIKMLHSMDDHEVYINIKNLRPKMTDEEKAERVAWMEQFKADFIAEHGYEPNEDYVRESADEHFPKNWVMSLNQFESDDDGGDTSNRHMELANPSLVIGFEDDLPDIIIRLREIIGKLSPQRQAVYRMVMLEKRTKVYAARKLGVSEERIRKDVKKIEQIISEDEILQKIFR